MERYDLMLTPTAPLPPFAIDREGPGKSPGSRSRMMPDARHVSLQSDGPARRSVPAGWSAGGLPAGLQIVGPGISPMRRS